MYELRFHPQVDKELGRLVKATVKAVKEFHLSKIASSPFEMGISLSGPLSRFRKYVFSHKGTSYRIAYEVDKDTRIVYVLMIGKREGFYERLERRARGL
jgi:mRNA-degrading endonuclease RelE of RelBE toxin-antitoxin system